MGFIEFFGVLFFCIWPLIAITIIAGIIAWMRKTVKTHTLNG
jgi:nitrate reductase NapE component